MKFVDDDDDDDDEHEIGLKKLETSLYCVAQNVFQYNEPFRHGTNKRSLTTCAKNWQFHSIHSSLITLHLLNPVTYVDIQ